MYFLYCRLLTLRMFSLFCKLAEITSRVWTEVGGILTKEGNELIEVSMQERDIWEFGVVVGWGGGGGW